MDWINIVFSIETLKKQVDYLLSQDPNYPSRGYYPNFSQSFEKDEKPNNKSKSQMRVIPVDENRIEDEESKVESPLKTYVKSKPSPSKNPVLKRYMKYQMLNGRN